MGPMIPPMADGFISGNEFTEKFPNNKYSAYSGPHVMTQKEIKEATLNKELVSSSAF